MLNTQFPRQSFYFELLKFFLLVGKALVSISLEIYII